MTCHLLHRFDPERNMARYYRVEVTRDLFGTVLLQRSWGRVGRRGQSRMAAFASLASAEAAALALVRSKERRGYRGGR